MKSIKNKEFFSKGKRGFIYVGMIGAKKVAIKTKNPRSKAVGRIENEANWLKKLNKKGIGPKFVEFKNDNLVYEFAEGEFILDWLINKDKSSIKEVLKAIFMQCRELDKLKVNKEEMHNPIKHIVVGTTITLLDFERCKKTEKPQNVTQFCQFVMSKKLKTILSKKGIRVNNKKLIKLLKEYKKDYSEKKFNEALKMVMG